MMNYNFFRKLKFIHSLFNKLYLFDIIIFTYVFSSSKITLKQ